MAYGKLFFKFIIGLVVDFVNHAKMVRFIVEIITIHQIIFIYFLLQMTLKLDVSRLNFGASFLDEWMIVAGGKTDYGCGRLCEKINLKTRERVKMPSLIGDKICCQLVHIN